MFDCVSEREAIEQWWSEAAETVRSRTVDCCDERRRRDGAWRRRTPRREASVQLQRHDHDGDPQQPRRASDAQRHLRVHHPQLPVLPREQAGLAELDPAQPEPQQMLRQGSAPLRRPGQGQLLDARPVRRRRVYRRHDGQAATAHQLVDARSSCRNQTRRRRRRDYRRCVRSSSASSTSPRDATASAVSGRTGPATSGRSTSSVPSAPPSTAAGSARRRRTLLERSRLTLGGRGCVGADVAVVWNPWRRLHDSDRVDGAVRHPQTAAAAISRSRRAETALPVLRQRPRVCDCVRSGTSHVFRRSPSAQGLRQPQHLKITAAAAADYRQDGRFVCCRQDVTGCALQRDSRTSASAESLEACLTADSATPNHIRAPVVTSPGRHLLRRR